MCIYPEGIVAICRWLRPETDTTGTALAAVIPPGYWFIWNSHPVVSRFALNQRLMAWTPYGVKSTSFVVVLSDINGHSARFI